MCERPGILSALRRFERAGALLINSPSAILNTYRERTVPLFERAGIPLPRSLIVPTTAPPAEISGPIWVKRADVHATQQGDVVFVEACGCLHEPLRKLAERGIPRAMIQEHVAGDLIKFYGVGDARRLPGRKLWFRWFYHKDQHLAGYPFNPNRLVTLAERAAAVLGLEVYGGDAIATRTGELFLIDLNAWPSFALYREEASGKIAAYLSARFTSAVACSLQGLRPARLANLLENV
jgi:Glutathione synthase/Ribosomal protein S6 modification enzyme (glutaminyl transferase)